MQPKNTTIIYGAKYRTTRKYYSTQMYIAIAIALGLLIALIIVSLQLNDANNRIDRLKDTINNSKENYFEGNYFYNDNSHTIYFGDDNIY